MYLISHIKFSIKSFAKICTKNPFKSRDCVIWDMGVAHNNFPNYSSEPRMTQYVRMVPNTPWAIEREKQTITNYWNKSKDTKELKNMIKKISWTYMEKNILGLNK